MKLICAFSGLLCVALAANGSPEPPVIPDINFADQELAYTWAGNQFITIDFPATKVALQDSITKKPIFFEAPSGGINISVWNNSGACLRLANKRIIFSRCGNDGVWQDFPTAYDRGFGSGEMQGSPLFIYESQNGGRFFSLETAIGFVHGTEASLCSWWKQGPNGIFEPDCLVHMEYDGPVFMPLEVASGAVISTLSNKFKGMLPFLRYPLRFPGGFAVVSWGAGILWIISDDPSISDRKLALSSSDPDFLSGKRKHYPALLGIQVAPNSHILAAVRSDELLYGESNTEINNAWDGLNPENEENQRSSSHKKIIWKDIDPSTGRVTEANIDSLSNLPKVLDLKQHFMFCFDLNGKVFTDDR